MVRFELLGINSHVLLMTLPLGTNRTSIPRYSTGQDPEIFYWAGLQSRDILLDRNSLLRYPTGQRVNPETFYWTGPRFGDILQDLDYETLYWAQPRL